MHWPDAFVLLTLGVAFWLGYRAGIVRELSGIVAIVAAFAVAGALSGAAASVFSSMWALSPSVAHLIAFWLLALCTFAAVRFSGIILERFTFLPGIAVGSRLAGGVVSTLKAVAFLWLLLFIALFFPVGREVRDQLRDSKSLPLIETLDGPVYSFIDASSPRLVRPLVRTMLKRHRL